MMPNEMHEKLKQAMGYKEDTECCGRCSHFALKTDGVMFGGPQMEPKPDRCTYNAIEFPVSTGGRCGRFKEREPFVKMVPAGSDES